MIAALGIKRLAEGHNRASGPFSRANDQPICLFLLPDRLVCYHVILTTARLLLASSPTCGPGHVGHVFNAGNCSVWYYGCLADILFMILISKIGFVVTVEFKYTPYRYFVFVWSITRFFNAFYLANLFWGCYHMPIFLVCFVARVCVTVNTIGRKGFEKFRWLFTWVVFPLFSCVEFEMI